MIRFAIGVGLLVAVGGCSAAHSTDERKPVSSSSEASAWIRIARERPHIAFPSGSPDGDKWEFCIERQKELIRSPLVLDAVVDSEEIGGLPELEAQATPVKWLSERVRLIQVGKSDLFRVSYAGRDPRHAVAIVNSVVARYFDIQKAYEAGQSRRVIDMLQVESELRRVELERLFKHVKVLEEEAADKHESAADTNSGSKRTGSFELELAQMDLALQKEVLLSIMRRITQLQTEQRAPDRVILLREAAVTP